jgi:hypothetical protein
MTSPEYTEYERLTKNMEADFLILTPTFMGYVEDVIFGEEEPDLRYYCFHFYNDSYLSHIFQRLSYRIEKLLKRTDSQRFPNLANGFINLLIYLKEPIARKDDEKYKAENYLYWRNVVIADPQLAYNSSFRKYLTAL